MIDPIIIQIPYDRLLEWIVKEIRKPKAIRTDNEPELISSVFMNCFLKHRIGIKYISRESLFGNRRFDAFNAFIERFNRNYRTEVLEARIFNSLIEVRKITSDWMEHYSNHKPHESLRNLSPMQYLLKEENSPNPSPNTEFFPFQ